MVQSRKRGLVQRMQALPGELRAESLVRDAAGLGMAKEELMGVATQLERAPKVLKRTGQQADQKVLADFRAGDGAARVGFLQDALPFLDTNHLVALPSKHVWAFEYDPKTEQKARAAAAWASWNTSSNLGRSLSEYWDQTHTTIWASQEDMVEGEPDDAAGPCRVHGICLCGNSRQGRTLGRMRIAWNAALKEQLQSVSVKAKALAASLVVEIKQVPDDEDTVMAEENVTGFEMHFLGHWSLLYLRPFRSTFHRLARLPLDASARTRGWRMAVR